MSERIEALHIIALEIDAQKKAGTPEHAQALAFVEEAKRLWREQLWNDRKCPHCQRTQAVLEETRRLLLELQRSMGKLQQMKLMKKQFDQVVNDLFEL